MVVDVRSGARIRPGRPGRIRLSPTSRPHVPRVRRDVLSAIGSVVSLRQAERAMREFPSPISGVLRAARDEFLGLVSHELRTPVTTIYGNSQLLLRRSGDLGSAEHHMVADIVQESERLLALVDNLLMLARIESGAPTYREPLLLTHHVRGTCETFAARHDREVSFEVRGDEDVVVDADRVHLNVLLANLLGNAVAYSRAGSEVRVVLEATPAEALVSILDRGIGLGREAEARFAEPFFRGDEAKRMTGGMGIGLTVCERIVVDHGGRLWARPRAAGGSEVGFTLPRVTVAEV